MAKNQLSEFFREKQAKAKPADADWLAKRDAWISAVERLYDTIEKTYLAETKSAVKVDRSRRKEITEPYIGAYSISEMALAVGEELVVFSPKGVNLVGAAGRVDVRGDRGEAMIVRQPGDRWSLVVSRTPSLRLVPITGDNASPVKGGDEALLDLLRSVMR